MEDKEYYELKKKIEKEEERRNEIARLKAEINNLESKRDKLVESNPFVWTGEVKLVFNKFYDHGDGKSGSVVEESMYLTDFTLVKEMVNNYIKKLKEKLDKLKFEKEGKE